jgi:RimJ/RimL family protein N-acetyltransferase
MTHHLSTLRLILREWRDSDLAAYAALNADADVRKHFGALLTQAESDAEAASIAAHFAAHGYGLFAVAVPGVSDFIGFNGIKRGSFDLAGVMGAPTGGMVTRLKARKRSSIMRFGN